MKKTILILNTPSPYQGEGVFVTGGEDIISRNNKMINGKREKVRVGKTVDLLRDLNRAYRP
ncbi:hypothetical protein ACFLUG_04490 [Chloroflexota bacterium]